MYKLIGICSILIVITIGWVKDAQLPAPEKINKAFPPSAEVKDLLEYLDSLDPPENESLKLFKQNFESRLALRALTCSPDSSIGRFDSVETIKKLPIDRHCLEEQDEQLKQVIGLYLINFRITQPPLRPIVKLGSPSIINLPDQFEIDMWRSASKANVAVLKSQNNELISIEIPNGKLLSKLPTLAEDLLTNFFLSPNGRVLSASVNNKGLLFLDVETGKHLWLDKDATVFSAWLPEMQSALVGNYKNNKNEVTLIDFKTGSIKAYLKAPDGFPFWSLPISESPSRVLIGFNSELYIVENRRVAEGVIPSLVKNFKTHSREGVNSGTLTLMRNGKAVAFSTSNQNFMIINIETGVEKRFDTKDFILARSAAKLNEEELLVDSYNHSLTVSSYHPWALNVNDSTLSPIETSEALSGELYPLSGRVGFMRKDRKRVWLADELNIGPPELLSNVIEGRKLEIQLTKLENGEKLAKARDAAMKAAIEINRVQQKLGMPNSSNINLTELSESILQNQFKKIERGSNVATLPAADASASIKEVPLTPHEYSPGAIEIMKQRVSEATHRTIGDIPNDTKVEAIGVYETLNRSPNGINVNVKKSNKPIVLILSGSLPIKWNLIKEPGANLVAVLATGTKISQVVGAGNTKVVVTSSNKYYPYEQNSPDFATLNNDSIMWTGKSIDRFQGSYSGSTFVVGSDY